MKSKCKMEILGYGIDFDNTELKRLFQDMAESRRIRGKKMIKKLQSLGLNIQWDNILAIKSKGVIGRPHFAQALIKLGYCSSKRDAFNRYLDRGKPGYVPRYKLFADEIVEIIHRANGVAILAHPFLSYKNMAQFQGDLRLLLDAGLDGVELYYDYSNHFKDSSPNPSDFQAVHTYLESLVAQYNLITTGGTDWHGHPSTTIRSVSIPSECMDYFLAQSSTK